MAVESIIILCFIGMLRRKSQTNVHLLQIVGFQFSKKRKAHQLIFKVILESNLLDCNFTFVHVSSGLCFFQARLIQIFKKKKIEHNF